MAKKIQIGKISLIFIVLLILIGSISINYIQFRENDTLSKVNNAIKEYQIFLAENDEGLNSVSNSLDKMNYSIDYTSCIAYNSKLEEIYGLYSLEELRTSLFLANISNLSNNKFCERKLGEYDKERIVLAKIRQDYIEADKNYCFGYHKVDWSSNWVEEYSTPFRRIGQLKSESSERVEKLRREAIRLCLS